MLVNHLVLAGGGHTHALILLRWAMNPQLRPKCLITLINRDSSTIYSGMFPGLISGFHQLEKASVDLRLLADRAGVSLVVGEIESLDLSQNRLFLQRCFICQPCVLNSGLNYTVFFTLDRVR